MPELRAGMPVRIVSPAVCFSILAAAAWALWPGEPEIFSAAVPIAGRPVADGKLRMPVYAIHGRRDEVIDLEPTRQAIDVLRAEGVNAQLVIIKWATHYETRRFAASLTGAVEWLRDVWDTAPQSSR